VAGGIVYLVQYVVHRREKKRDKEEGSVVRFTNEERRITRSIFNYLGPRSSIELMKTQLGPPNKKVKEKIGLFSEDPSFDDLEDTNSYIYFFKNAQVKITSKDNETIDSLSVVASDTDIAFNNLFYFNPDEKDEFLNVANLTPEMLEGCRAEQFLGCRDSFTVAQKVVGNPFFVYLTYFCDYSADEDVSKNPGLLVGSVINGICLSSDPNTVGYVFIEQAV
jgi:hypothetical protein